MAHERPSWDEYFMGFARQAATRGTCDRGRTGTVIVRDKNILSTGYVGSPPGLPHCDEVGHEMRSVINDDGTTSQHCIRTTHAEQNAIAQAAKNGNAIKGATLYCKLEPCYDCAKLIVTAGIERVVCEKRYHRGQRTRDLFEQAEIELIVFSEEIEKYENQ